MLRSRCLDKTLPQGGWRVGKVDCACGGYGAMCAGMKRGLGKAGIYHESCRLSLERVATAEEVENEVLA